MPAALEWIALPAFTDNYIWMLHDGVQALVVDPGEAAPVLDALQARGLRLAAILVTHHHGDHIGGVAGLRGVLEGQVFAPPHALNPQPCVPVQDGQSLELLGQHFDVLGTPGHTADHVSYLLQQAGQPPLLFCGDTLFSAGCGRVFDGSLAQLHASLQRLAALPDQTRICCAHEYTLSNLRFARTIEPANEALARYEAWCEARRAAQDPTLPALLATELLINPFLRCREPAVKSAVSARLASEPCAVTGDADEPLAVFSALRLWKNEFR